MYTKFLIIAIVCIKMQICFPSWINVDFFQEKNRNKSKNEIYSDYTNYANSLDYYSDEFGILVKKFGTYTHLISGGYRPERHMFAKYMVSIRTAKPTEYFGDNHLCSGTIVASTLILTAAHCVMDLKKVVTRPIRLMVIAGTPNRLKRAKSTVEFEVLAVIPHPEFKPKGEHDIALLRLKTPIPHDNDNIKILPMIKFRLPAGSNCTTLGWGQLFLNGPYAAEVVYLDQNIVDAKSCMKLLRNSYSYDVFCGVNIQQKYGKVCRGDSGGPLICNRQLAGIIRWGPPCTTQYPSAYTAVSEYLDWINSVNVAYVLKPTHGILYALFIIVIFQFYI